MGEDMLPDARGAAIAKIGTMAFDPKANRAKHATILNTGMTPPQWIRDAWREDPDKDDVLFLTPEEWTATPKAELGPWQASARLRGLDGDMDSEAYASGYYRAAQLLAEYSVRTGRETDFLIYPIIFLYRHHIELRLKRIIPVAAGLSDQPLQDEESRVLSTTHRLDQLWKLFETRLEKMRRTKQFKISGALLEGVQSYIRQLTEIDKQSFSFRFPYAKDGTTPTLQDIKHINVARTTVLMERLANCFVGFDNKLSEQYQGKSELLYRARQEAAAEGYD